MPLEGLFFLNFVYIDLDFSPTNAPTKDEGIDITREKNISIGNKVCEEESCVESIMILQMTADITTTSNGQSRCYRWPCLFMTRILSILQTLKTSSMYFLLSSLEQSRRLGINS